MWGTRVGTVRRVAAGGALAAALTGACAQEATLDLTATGAGVALTTESLAAAADRSGAEAYRYETDITTWTMGDPNDPEQGFAITVATTGAVDGDNQSSSTDMGATFEDVPGDPVGELFDTDDLVVETMVVDGTMYMRAPFFAAALDAMLGEGLGPSDLGPFGPLGELGDDWGSIDLDALPGPITTGDVTGSGGLDPTGGLDLLAGTADQRSLGSDEIRGVPVEGVAATVTMEDLMVASGGDADDLDEELPPGMIDGPGGSVDRMLALEIPVEAWVDGDGLVRRFVMDLDLGDIADLGPGAPEDMPASVRMRMTTDFFDFGDESITIEAPSDSVDITEAFRDLAEGSFPIDGGVITS